VKCWGSNAAGQIGNGVTYDSAHYPLPLAPTTVLGVVDAVAISAGGGRACVVNAAGQLWCWGSMQVDAYKSRIAASPELVAGLPTIVDVTVGSAQICALDEAGQAYCWGQVQNEADAGFANGKPVNNTPTLVPGLEPVVSLSLSEGYLSRAEAVTVAVTANGEVRAWGDGHLGQDSGISLSTVPLPVAGLTDAVAAAGTCVLSSTGLVSCWGEAYWGWGDLGRVIEHETPVSMDGVAQAVAISAVVSQACAVLADGHVRCWGQSEVGGFGDASDLSMTATALEVCNIEQAVSVAVGWYHACALLADGNVACWGSNDKGQLGVGRARRYLEPVLVEGL
jgi:alpha-tubulin suppressor-like RCC1 family protein